MIVPSVLEFKLPDLSYLANISIYVDEWRCLCKQIKGVSLFVLMNKNEMEYVKVILFVHEDQIIFV